MTVRGKSKLSPRPGPGASQKKHAHQKSPEETRAGSETGVVLLAVTGMSPAILTETIWALAHEQLPVIPERVIALTTAQGRDELAQLFLPSSALGGTSPWAALRTELQRRGKNVAGRLRFGITGEDVRVITAYRQDDQGTELRDIRSREDNDAAADFTLEHVRAIVENPDTRLVASIAGGRKTMGALLYACMTLVGRETDTLTHVLVNEPYDTLRGFWFPGQPGGPLKDREGLAHDPTGARVELARVPFVPLRNLFIRDLGRKAGTFSNLVEQSREHIRHRAGENIRLEVESVRRAMWVNGQEVKLNVREYLVMLLLARRLKAGEPPLSDYKTAIDPLNALRAELNAQVRPHNFSDWRHPDVLKFRFDDDQAVRQAVSGVRIKLREMGGEAASLGVCLPEKNRFSLSLTPSLVFLK